MKAIILAAGMGTRLESASGGIPKAMVEVAGKPMIDRMFERIAEAGLSEIIVVSGYRADALEEHVRNMDHPLAKTAVFVHNEKFAEWGNFYSLLIAEEAVGDDGFIKIDGDVVCDEKVLPAVVASPGPLVLALDCRDNMGEEEMKVRVDESGRPLQLSKKMDPASAVGEYIGVDRVDAEMTKTVFDKLRALIDLGETHEYYERAYDLLMQEGKHFHIADVSGCVWTEIDDAKDLEAAHDLASE